MATKKKKNTYLKDSFLLSLETPILDNINRSFECKKREKFCTYTFVSILTQILRVCYYIMTNKKMK